MSSLIIFLVLIIDLSAKEKIYYNCELVDKSFLEETSKLLDDSNIDRSYKEDFNNPVSSLDNCNICLDSTYFKSDEYYFICMWQLNEKIPVFYNTEYDSLPSYCLVYSTKRTTNKVLLFQKITKTLLNTSFDNYQYGIGSLDSSEYLIHGKKLKIKLGSTKYEDVFVICDNAKIYNTKIGKVLFRKHYKKTIFFNNEYENIYEFYLFRKEESKIQKYLLWFDNDFNLVRIESKDGGYFLR